MDLALLDAAVRRLAGPGARVLAVGWATVDLDRAEREAPASLGPLHRLAPGDLAEPALGATARPLRLDRPAAALLGARLLVLLEPATEGRLAAALARAGEGPCVAWVAVAENEAGSPSGEPGPDTAGFHAGPLGSERLLVAGPPWGPHVLMVRPAGGTISA